MNSDNPTLKGKSVIEPGRETVGKTISDIIEKDNLNPAIRNEKDKLEAAEHFTHETYVKRTMEAIEQALLSEEYKGRDFVVLNIIKRNDYFSVPELYTYIKHTVPIPHYGQIVYKYHASAGHLEHLWMVPPKFICKQVEKNPSFYEQNQPTIFEQVALFRSGMLNKLQVLVNERWADQENARRGTKTNFESKLH